MTIPDLLVVRSIPHPLQGFVQRELVGEACRGLHKRCVAATELLMQSMEALDSIVRH